ncbi:globin family protein [Schlesneria paludicola]|uniref:hypothetical protein n=1 Tax=Schlesneria paludicola TaxID=360056 RepID=UPI000299D294|nr:hypothetical protein [Schlesneria paludicola]
MGIYQVLRADVCDKGVLRPLLFPGRMSRLLALESIHPEQRRTILRDNENIDGMVAFLQRTMKENPDLIKEKLINAALVLGLTEPEMCTAEAIKNKIMSILDEAIDSALGQIDSFGIDRGPSVS